MMGSRKTADTLFNVRTAFDYDAPPSSFFAQLARGGQDLFKDQDFQDLYEDDCGRYSVPPSQLALLLVMQAYTGCSDEEAVERSACDLRWCAVLAKPAGAPLCVKSTFQQFRLEIIKHAKGTELLRTSLRKARAAGLLQGKEISIFIDTKPVVGRGSVEDTYNLLGRAMKDLVGAIAEEAQRPAEEWARDHDLGRYVGAEAPSLKGSANIDWADRDARNAFLSEIVVDALRLGRIGRALLSELSKASLPRESLQRAVELLEQILAQDVVIMTEADGSTHAEIKQGTAPDRIPSATDPEQRHGRKSKSKRFVGYKVRISVARGNGLITGVDVLPGNTGDADNVLGHVEEVETNTGAAVRDSTGDCAFGSGETRQEFADANRTLFAKVPQPAANGEFFPKAAFTIDLEAGTVSCPAGQTTSAFREDQKGMRIFSFGERCATCPLRGQCTKAKEGRTVQVHPQEAMLMEARAFQQTEAGKEKLRERLAVENGLGRMAGYGIGQARYVGQKKTLFQAVLTATVVNLRRVFNVEAEGRLGVSGPDGPGGGSSGSGAPTGRSVGGAAQNGDRNGPGAPNERCWGWIFSPDWLRQAVPYTRAAWDRFPTGTTQVAYRLT